MNCAAMRIFLQAVGLILIGIALMHFGLPRRFNWATELPKLAGFNRHMFVVQCTFVAYNSFLMGCICLFAPDTLLVKTQAGLVLTLFLTLYWLPRLWCQFFAYPKELWIGKRFETSMHILFSCIWIFAVLTFGSTLFLQLIGVSR
jgi:hypothetical protein